MTKIEILKKVKAELEAEWPELVRVAECLLEEVPEDDYYNVEVVESKVNGEYLVKMEAPIPDGATKPFFVRFLLQLNLMKRQLCMGWSYKDGDKVWHSTGGTIKPEACK